MGSKMLTGKIALVTGASRGIGREIAKTLAREGAVVIVNYNGSQSSALETVREIEEQAQKAELYQCNVADFKAVGEMIENIIKKYGKLDIVVNNAGITKDNLLMRMTEEEFDQVLDINLKGAFNCMKHVSRQMLKQKSGRIINISSVSGVLGNAGQANYCASKAGLIGLTKSTARELAPKGITVNAVAPGFIQSDMTDSLTDSVKETILGQIPMKKMGMASDIAEMVVFLASEKANYITGQVIQINGGMAM